MDDVARAALFALSLVAVLGTSLALIGPARAGPVGVLLGVWVLACGQVILIAQALSLLHMLDWPGFLLGHLACLTMVLVWQRRRPAGEHWRALRELRAGLAAVAPALLDRRAPAVPIIAVATFLTGVLCALVAVWVPPNSVDALTYHMGRVGHYLQFQSLDVYPTMDLRKVSYPANAEILILWTVAFLRADLLANTVQLGAWAVSAVAVYGLGRRAGLNRPAGLFAAGSFVLLPQAVLQSATAHNDLLVASFTAATLYFLLEAFTRPRPGAWLLLAGLAGGLAIGTKPTAVFAAVGLAAAFAALVARRRGREVAFGVAAAGLAVLALGSYIYVQNWVAYGRLSGPEGAGRTTWFRWADLPVNLSRTLYTFAFADLSGPLAHPIVASLTQEVAAAGVDRIAGSGISPPPQAGDPSRRGQLAFLPSPRVHDYFSGVGPIGGAMLVAAVAALVWPGRLISPRRLLALTAASSLVAVPLFFGWSPYGAGRFILIPCLFAAPLLGVLLQRPTRWPRTLAVVLAMWGAVTGLYVAVYNEGRPLPDLPGRDRLGLMLLGSPGSEAFHREVAEELGPGGVVGLYGFRRPDGTFHAEHLFFGPRFERIVLPLVDAADREGRRPVAPRPWTNQTLVDTYRPPYIAVQSIAPAVQALPDVLPGRCFDLPLRGGKPRGLWELWRCEDRDPRSLVENGDFALWSRGPGPFEAEGGAARIGETADAWSAIQSAGARLRVSKLEPVPGGEPFRVRLEYRPAESGGRAAIRQALPLAQAPPGSTLVVDARLRADRPGAAVLTVADGAHASESANRTTNPETLRVRHRVDSHATGLWILLDVSGAREDATVLVRSILAIPRREGGAD